MSNTKHTPGPWKMLGKIKGNEIHVWVYGKDPSDGVERELQVISLQDSHPIKEHLERRFADMKLIAAAPELLQALKECLKHVELGSKNPIVLNAKELIQKAEGK
jgi:hypothetical protein